ncbi:MAG: hypothetical protein AB1641_26590 [Thermodesulfobacteriota bacterium]
MPGPVHMNQVIAHTPSVERVQLSEQQAPDQTMRQAAFEAQAQLRQNTETVKQTPATENTRIGEREKQQKEKRRRRKSRTAPEEKAGRESTGPTSGDQAGPGHIVNVVV